MFLQNKFICLLLLGGLALLQGCVALQSFPTVARGGDTITLFVGSPSGMTKTNTAVTYVSDIDASVVTLPIRSIIRLRPDQTSQTALFDNYLYNESSYTGHSPWMTVIVIDLPEGLTVGLGHVDVNSLASYGTLPQGVNDIPISLEIIDGVGAPNIFTYNNGFGGVGPGDLSALEALPQVVIQPPNLDAAFAAAQIKVNIPMVNTSTGGPVLARDIRVVADDFYANNGKKMEQVQMSWSRNGDEFTVNFINPSGWANPLRLRFSVVLNTGNNTFVADPGPSLVSVNLYDENGSPITLGGAVPDIDLFTIGIE